MKKVFNFNVAEGKIYVEVEMVQVNCNSAITGMLGDFNVLKMQGILKDANNRLVRTGNLSDLLGQLVNEDELANKIISLWHYNQAYTCGTLRQLELIDNPTLEYLLKNPLAFKKAVERLNDKNMLNDRGVTFGGKMTVIPLPVEILDLATDLLA